MIYIDPPYNTGNDFIYEDDFAESTEEFLIKSNQKDEFGNRLVANTESNGRFHSDWLTMIYPRLKLARNLLSDDGVIFISIDDNEQANLKRLCDEVFGEENFFAEIAWRKTDNQANIGQIARVKEYVVCCAKNNQFLNLNKIPLTDKAKKEYSYKDENGHFRRSILLHKTRGRHFYEVKTKNGNILNGPWMVKEVDFREKDKNNEILWTSSGDEQPYGKIYLHKSNGQIPNDFWDTSFGSNQEAGLNLEKLFEQRLFDFPKSTKFLKNLITIGSGKDSLILDFFAGSSTTAHAVMQLNAEDGGNRKFIMAQLPEACDEKSEAFKAGYKNIAEISKERIRRAGKKILEGQTHEGWNKDVGFRVLKVDSSNMKDVYYSPNAINQADLLGVVENIKPDRKAEDLLFQVLLDLGVDLSFPITKQTIQGKTVFFVNNFVNSNELVACFDGGITEELVKEIAKTKPKRAVCKDNGFVSDSVKINAQQIFKQISPSTDIKSI